jgi:hypothetical protein
VAEQKLMEALLTEQRRTNRLLAGLVYVGVAVIVSLLGTQIARHFLW